MGERLSPGYIIGSSDVTADDSRGLWEPIRVGCTGDASVHHLSTLRINDNIASVLPQK